GKDVLKKRLAAKRSEIGFLVQMLSYSPEMVAVVFHRGFRFAKPAAMQRLLTLQPEALPAWPELAGAVALEPWAEPVARKVLAEPGGPAFMTVAACLEFLHAHGFASADAAPKDADEGDDSARDRDDDDDGLSTDDAHGPRDERSLDEAGADWLAEQGFERKD
ncbi:MAG: hypothetical protein KBC92_09060, partial [Giesbergeria sp.]|nr:hypothetical protein [Giesbergeria sp.]